MTVATQVEGSPQAYLKRILDMNYAFTQTAILLAAIRHSLFTYLSHEKLTARDLAERAQLLPDPTERLLKALAILGLVEKSEQKYQLTPMSDLFLVEGKATYLGGDTLAMLDYLPAWLQLDETLRTAIPYRDLGQVATAEAFFAPRVRDLFSLAYPLATRVADALPLEEHRTASLHLLDVGAGGAPWSAAFARRYPTAHVTAIDLPSVVEQGKQQIASVGLSERYSWIAADMETTTYSPLGYDIILLCHVCRFLGKERSQGLLRKLEQSLRPDGLLLLADVFLADDQQGPPPALTIDLSMLVNTAQGGVWSCNEVAAWLSASGLHQIRRLDVAGPFPILVAQKG